MSGTAPRLAASYPRLFRFALVGGVGFIVDATVLTLLVNGLGYDHYASRAVSFSLAVTVTWLLNRRWVFQAGSPTGREYSGYFAVQLLGAFINLGVYVLVIELVPALAAIPVVPLAVGSAVAMFSNFLLARRFVFRQTVAGLEGEGN